MPPLKVLLYRHQGLLGLLVVLVLLVVAGVLAAPALRASRLGQLVRLGSGAVNAPNGAPMDGRPLGPTTATAAPSSEATLPPPSAQPAAPAASEAATPGKPLPVRAAAVGHATLASSVVVDAFNCVRAEAGLLPYTTSAQLTQEATEVARRIAAGGRGPQPGERDWTLTGSLVLDTASTTTDGCAVGGLDLGEIPDLDRASQIGIAVVPLPEPGLVMAVVVGR